MVQPSPYTPGEVARDIPGRDKQLAEIDERLTYMIQLQRLVPRIRVDHAPRGVGKTSLLRQVQRRAESLGAATIWVTAGEAVALIPAVAAEVARVSRSWEPEGRGRIRTALQHLEVKVGGGLPGLASVEATWRGTPARSRASAGISATGMAGATREFEDLVTAAAAAARAHGHGGLVLLLDEVQAADPSGLRTLSYAWQHFQSERPDLPAAVFAAGLPDSVTMINQAVSNSERFAYRHLEDLSPDAALIALAAPARTLGVRWEDAALRTAVEYAAGYPHTLQLVGDNAWRMAGLPDPGASITDAHVRAALHNVAEDLHELYTARLSKVTNPNDLRFVKALASLGDGQVRRAQIAAAMNVPSDALGIPRARLRDSGIITDTAHGYVAFTIPGFASHVRQAFDLPEIPLEHERASRANAGSHPPTPAAL